MLRNFSFGLGGGGFLFFLVGVVVVASFDEGIFT
jgi:hypothetical protein